MASTSPEAEPVRQALEHAAQAVGDRAVREWLLRMAADTAAGAPVIRQAETRRRLEKRDEPVIRQAETRRRLEKRDEAAGRDDLPLPT